MTTTTGFVYDSTSLGLDAEIWATAPGAEKPVVKTHRGPWPVSVGRPHPACVECEEERGRGLFRLDLATEDRRFSRHAFCLERAETFTLHVTNHAKGQRMLVNDRAVDQAEVRAGDVVTSGVWHFWLRKVGWRKAARKQHCGWCGSHFDLEHRLRKPGRVRGDTWYCEDCVEASSKLPAGLEDRYEYLDTLGGGGMGLVFLVRHKVLDSRCVLKILRPELAQQRDFVDRFAKREVLLMAKAGAHPNIVEALDAGWSSDGAPFLLMQFVDGPSLAALIRDRGPLNLNDALRHFEQIVALLDHLYEKDLLHRDIKSNNLMLAPGEILRLTDFGLAKALATARGPVRTNRGTRMGTMAFAAPEQLEDASGVDCRADIYSAGAVLYHMLAGIQPLEDLPFEDWLDAEGRKREPTPIEERRGDVPPRVAALLRRAMEPDPGRRFATPSELRAALHGVLARR